MGDSPYYLDIRKITLADLLLKPVLCRLPLCHVFSGFGKLAIINIKLITVVCVCVFLYRVL